MTDLLDARQFDAATRCVQTVLERGTTSLTVEELREAAGISKRTFHRWFPTKARALQPYYAAVTERFSAAMAQAPHLDQRAVTRAWVKTVLGEDPTDAVRLYGLVREDPEYWSVFLEVVEDGETAITATLLELPSRPTPVQARVGAVAIVASSRLALDAGYRGTNPRTAFTRWLTAFAPEALAP